MSLNKRIKSIIIITVLSALVICGYYLVSYIVGNGDVETRYKYTDEQIEYLKNSPKMDIYIFTPEYMFYPEKSKADESEESKGFKLPSASELGEKLGSSIREAISNSGIAADTGERANEYETVINGFLESLTNISDNVNFHHDENGEYAKNFGVDKDLILFKKGDKIEKVPYDDFFVTLENGTKYAFDRNKIVNIIKTFNNDEISDTPSLFALSGYDINGDTVSPITGNAFVFPAITSRYDVEYMQVRNQNGSFSILQDVKTKNFYFKNAVTMSYDQEKFSNMLMSGIYMLANGKVENPASLAEYGLDSEENATAVVEILKTNGELHQVIIGNKTLDGKGYYAKYYKKDIIYILPNDIENGLLLSAKDFLGTSLVHAVSTVEGVYSIDDIKVNFLKEDKELKVVLIDDDDDDGTQIFSIWKILSPEELIPIGKEFGNPNSTNFTEFIQSVANLSTETIMEYEMTQIPVDGAIISGIPQEAFSSYDKKTIDGFDVDTLKKYGLDNPRLDVSYSYPIKDKSNNEYKVVSRVFISEEQEDGLYYAYSYLYTYDKSGKIKEIVSTGCITSLTLSHVDWLDWGVMDFNNQFLYKNFVYNLDWIEVEYQNEIYRFNVDGSAEKEDVNSVTLVHEGTTKDIDVQTFKFLYSSILNIYMVDNYDIADEDPNMMCRITIHAGGGSTEMIFYRVTNTKAFYTLNGEGKYYVKANTVFDFLTKYQKVLSGQTLLRDE